VGSISGLVFFDVNANGVYDGLDIGIDGVRVVLSNGQEDISGPTPAGGFSFNVPPGPVQVSVPAMQSILAGLIATTPLSQWEDVMCSAIQVNFGFRLDLTFIDNQPANGHTQGFWKTNLRKAIRGQTTGVQVTAAQLQNYVNTLSNFLLFPLNVHTLQEAADIFEADHPGPMTVEKAKTLLSIQLLASEFNYLSGAYIGNNQLFTLLFLYYGEYLLATSSDVALILQAQQAFDAYNNAEGGLIQFP
jgi:hypothetical protein